jgi:ferric-dicitrate binding protein FerR (iron transport regulator)
LNYPICPPFKFLRVLLLHGQPDFWGLAKKIAGGVGVNPLFVVLSQNKPPIMMENHWEMITKCLAGEASPEEVHALREWRQQHPDHEQLYQEVALIWHSKPAAQDQFNSQAAFRKLTARFQREALLSAGPAQQRRTIGWRTGMAATLALMLIASGVFYLQRQQRPVVPQVAWVQKQTQAKQRLKLTLPDGSRVWLNANSHLGYPKDFAGANREVKLVGEAYFEVAHRPTQPFLVRAGAGGQAPTVRVLGTKFNLNTTNDDGQVETVLAEGKVAFEVPGQVANPLAPNELLAFDPQTQQMEKRQVDAIEYTGWKDGNLVFRDEAMRRVLRRLERFYGVNIEVQNPTLLRCRITANFNNQPLAQVLDYLKTLTQVEYQIANEQVKLRGGKCK